MRTRKRFQWLFKKHNKRKLGEFTVVLMDGFYRKKLDEESGNLENCFSRLIQRTDEKYNIDWRKIKFKRMNSD